MVLNTDPKAKVSSRPYTSYNIFFQLEREHILQQELSVIPSLTPEQTFHCSDKNYEGPALPPKYQCLLLLKDWYIPGKALRKKRRHRASHGKISFKDLSKKIASAWHNCDDTVKLFCAEVSEIGMMKYKREKHSYKQYNKVAASKRQSQSKATGKPKTSQQLKDISRSGSSTVSPEVSQESTSASIEICPECIPSTTEICLECTPSSTETSLECKPPSSTAVPLSADPCKSPTLQPSENGRLGLVKMQDDEIFNIWTSSL